MISLKPVRKEDHDLLWNINQKYLYEMTNYYDDPMDEYGNFHYGHFEEYFTDPARKAFFIYNDKTMIGFAMICPYSSIGHHPDYTMAEFTIFPAFRRRHYALETAKKILSLFPGNWEIKYNENNTGAKRFWMMVTAPYHPVIHHLNEEETVFEFSTTKGTVT